MRIAIASGKGGTGKTTVATNLAFYLKHFDNTDVTLIDCDVEEPNSHIFLRPDCQEPKVVTVPVPVVQEDLCTACGKCAEICQFNAIACVKEKVLIFPELCHGCGGCLLVCPTGAITEKQREIGVVENGKGKDIKLVYGRLHVGEAMSPPLIRAVKEFSPVTTDEIQLIDCPPGTSCPVITAVSGSDFVLLVTEPTPFGLNDLKLAVEMVRILDIPFAVGINRSTADNNMVQDYCRTEGIPVILNIPHDRRIAEAYSTGKLILESLPEYHEQFSQVLGYIKGVLS